MTSSRSSSQSPAARSGLFALVARNTAWLYTAEFLPRLAGLLVVPIWSARVAPGEYARWILALTSAELLLETCSLGFANFMNKVLYRYHDARAQEYFGMAAAVVLGTTVLGAVGVAVGSPWLSRVMIGAGARQDLFAWLGLYAIVAQVNNLAILYVSTLIRYRAYFRLVTVRWVGNAGFLLWFLLGAHQGFYSWVWAWVATEALLLPLSLAQLREVRWRRWKPRMLSFACRFSLPMLTTNVLGWGQSRVGRYILSFAGVNTGLGLYGVAQTLSKHYGAAVRPTKLVAQGILGHVLEEQADSPYFLEFFHVFSCLALSLAFVIALFLGDLMKLVVSPAYWGATVALPVLIFTAYLGQLYSLYESLMFRYFKVWFQFFGSLITFLVVILATICLVPRIGFLGAALGQLMGGIAMVVYAHRYARRVSSRAFRFGEKMALTVGAFALVNLAERGGLSLASKAALAAVVIGWHSWLYWHRRHTLFPLAAHAIMDPTLQRSLSVLSSDPEHAQRSA